jgi:hypothetical protein
LQPPPTGRLRRAARPTDQAPPSPVQHRIRRSDLLHRASLNVRGTHKIEHRLFCHISQSWRGRPLVSYEVVINSIAATTTSTGLKVYARLDERDYPKKVQVPDNQLAAVNLTPDPFHAEWNYSISPRATIPHHSIRQVI